MVAAAALRGYKDTQAIFYVTIVAYWGLGLPTGMILGLTDWLVPRMGPQGFWIGFIVGLTSAALMLGRDCATSMAVLPLRKPALPCRDLSNRAWRATTRLQNQQAAQELGKQSPLCIWPVDSLGGMGSMPSTSAALA